MDKSEMSALATPVVPTRHRSLARTLDSTGKIFSIDTKAVSDDAKALKSRRRREGRSSSQDTDFFGATSEGGKNFLGRLELMERVERDASIPKAEASFHRSAESGDPLRLLKGVTVDGLPGLGALKKKRKIVGARTFDEKDLKSGDDLENNCNSADSNSGDENAGVCEDKKKKSLDTRIRKREDIVGTPEYLSPEILIGQEHNFAVDWWALGIILFELLFGLPPFTGDTPAKVFENILSSPVPWHLVEETGVEVSDDARDLIQKLLVSQTHFCRIRAGACSQPQSGGRPSTSEHHSTRHNCTILTRNPCCRLEIRESVLAQDLRRKSNATLSSRTFSGTRSRQKNLSLSRNLKIHLTPGGVSSPRNHLCPLT
jgi:serine/threonine protein kinase